MSKICGIDEVGRGPLAGPVISAAVILPANHNISGLADSKKISQKKREMLFDEILSVADIGLGIVSSKVIDRINILQATYKSMIKSVENLTFMPDKILIDGFSVPTSKFKSEGVIKGDQKIEQISAASIVAKVCRDRLMKMIDPVYPDFDFDNNKGYGTKTHIEALKRFKATLIHRKSFSPVKYNLPTATIDDDKINNEKKKLVEINNEINNWLKIRGIIL